jgi:hypothetical protein
MIGRTLSASLFTGFVDPLFTPARPAGSLDAIEEGFIGSGDVRASPCATAPGLLGGCADAPLPSCCAGTSSLTGWGL